MPPPKFFAAISVSILSLGSWTVGGSDLPLVLSGLPGEVNYVKVTCTPSGSSRREIECDVMQALLSPPQVKSEAQIERELAETKASLTAPERHGKIKEMKAALVDFACNRKRSLSRAAARASSNPDDSRFNQDFEQGLRKMRAICEKLKTADSDDAFLSVLGEVGRMKSSAEASTCSLKINTEKVKFRRVSADRWVSKTEAPNCNTTLIRTLERKNGDVLWNYVQDRRVSGRPPSFCLPSARREWTWQGAGKEDMPLCRSIKFR